MANNTETISPTPEAGELYFEAQMSSLEEMVQLRIEDTETDHDLIINEWCLSVETLTEEEEITYFCEDAQEEVTYQTGEHITVGHKFLLTWGGPSAWITTKDNGQTYTYTYCDWFGSDWFTCPILGDNLDNVSSAFDLYFDCLEDSQRVMA